MNLIYGIKDKPKFGQMLVFAFQQVLAILAATIAVPAIVGNGMSASAALFGAGIGTLVYQLFTKFRSPVFLGSSFAFIGSMVAAFAGAASASAGFAGLVIGEFAVSSGWFNSEAMLYMAFVAIATYAQTSFEMGYALKFMRLLLLILTQLFGLWGYIAGILITVCAVAFNKTLSGRNYLYPLIPWDGRQLVKRLFRVSLQWSEKNKYSKR